MIDGKFCCGCMSCYNVCPQGAIERSVSEKGFYSVRVNHEKCIECGLCAKVCPEQNVIYNTEEQEYYAFQLENTEKRLQSQSGGAFTAIAEYVLNEGGICYGVAMVNNKAQYVRVETLEKLDILKGSKYVQAEVGDIISEVINDLKKDKFVLFSGTPCTVSGIRNLLEIKKIPTEKYMCVDLICHGVPSPMIYGMYINMIEEKYGKVKNFNFRDKRLGWKDSICSFDTSDETLYSRDYIKIFLKNICLNENCYSCKYATTERCGDITIGDFWGIEKTDSSLSDPIGTSLVIINTKRGKDTFSAIKEQTIYEKRNKDECLQTNLIVPSKRNVYCEEFWDELRISDIKTVFEKYCDFKNENNIEIELDESKIIKKIYDYLKDREITEIYLYGTGKMMFNVIRYFSNYSIDISIEGVFDKSKQKIGKEYFGYKVYDAGNVELCGKTVIICTYSTENCKMIKKRLENDKNYVRAKIIGIEDCIIM